MSDRDPSTSELENLRAAYAQVCSGYQAVDDFRAKLLALLPIASGAGIFLLFSDTFAKSDGTALLPQFLLPIGAFGIAVTLGLYCYELRGIQYCTHLIEAGANLERQLRVPGRFSTRPKRFVAGWISELSASHLIYAAVLGAWTFVAAVVRPSAQPWTSAVPLASIVALAAFTALIVFALRVELMPPPKEAPAAQVLSAMLALIRPSPAGVVVGRDIEQLQQSLLELARKNVSPSSSDWLAVNDIVSKLERVERSAS